jgi:hypothetical protein
MRKHVKKKKGKKEKKEKKDEVINLHPRFIAKLLFLFWFLLPSVKECCR